MNTLYYGDNLHVLRTHVADESVDLVYLDPPFNSGRDYNAVFEDGDSDGKKATAQVKAFTDTWRWDDAANAAYEEVVRDTSGEPLRLKLAETMKAFRVVLGTGSTLAYLSMMAPRLVELRRVLKPTGSLYLHCDPTASHYLKMLLDGIFGRENFRNEVIWKRTSAHNDPGRFGNVHDVILFYGKSDKGTWDTVYQPYDESYLKSHYGQADLDGRRYRLSDLSGPGTTTGPSGLPWRGADPTKIGRSWSVPKYLRASLNIPKGATPQEALDILNVAGRIIWPKNGGMPAFKRYLDEMPGLPCQDTWTDIPPLNSQAAERLGYPTQKPRALLERILRASSNEGDVVLDPFAGCGTCLDAAVVLKRKWIGIDITHVATNVIKKRLEDVHNLHPGKGRDYVVVGEPADLAGAQQLAEDDPHQFQTWALGLVGARTEAGPAKKGGDKGIDGVKVFGTSTGTTKCLISVKSGNVTSGMIRDLRGTLEREKAAMGLLVTLKPPTGGMKQEAREAGTYEPEGLDALVGAPEIPRIQIVTIEDLLEGRSPTWPAGVSTTDKTIKRARRQ